MQIRGTDNQGNTDLAILELPLHRLDLGLFPEANLDSVMP